MSAYLLISQCLPIAYPRKRVPLRKIVLPVSIVRDQACLPSSEVWWTECLGKQYFLRAKFVVSYATQERDLDSGRMFLGWYLDPRQSERISWPSTKRENVNISHSLTRLVNHNSSGPQLMPIESDLEVTLEDCRLRAPVYVTGYQEAKRILSRVITRSWRERPVFNVESNDLKHAWRYVSDYFCREELVRTAESQPYLLAAAALLGYSDLPSMIYDAPNDSEESTSNQPFMELTESQPSYVERFLKTSASSTGAEKLMLSTKRHQQIVQDVARAFRTKGYAPQYSQLVDLCVERADDVLFFEVKSADEDNFSEQIREAVAQLLEYEFRYRARFYPKPIRLAVVAEAGGSAEQRRFAQDFLTDVGVNLILWSEQQGFLTQQVEPSPQTSLLSMLRDATCPTITSATAKRSSTYTVPMPYPSLSSTNAISAATDKWP